MSAPSEADLRRIFERSPIGIYRSTADEKGSSSLSLLWSEGRSGDKSYFNLHPLWWSSSDRNSAEQKLVPFYFASQSTNESTVLTPL